jgi:hypothetical protein
VVKDFLQKNPNHPKLIPMPFNSGYFMSFRCKGIDAEALRKRLLSDCAIGTIALGAEILRVAFSPLEVDQIPEIFGAIYKTAAEM